MAREEVDVQPGDDCSEQIRKEKACQVPYDIVLSDNIRCLGHCDTIFYDSILCDTTHILIRGHYAKR